MTSAPLRATSLVLAATYDGEIPDSVVCSRLESAGYSIEEANAAIEELLDLGLVSCTVTQTEFGAFIPMLRRCA